MKKGNLTRDQAIQIVGADAVTAAENESCDYTGRVGYNGSCQGDDLVEFSASAGAVDSDGYDVHVIAYYYQDAADVDAEESLDGLVWTIYGYEVI